MSARELGTICEETMTACLEETGEIVPVRFVDEEDNDVTLDDGRLAAFIFGPDANGKYFRSGIKNLGGLQ